jgi:hypothetical protein
VFTSTDGGGSWNVASAGLPSAAWVAVLAIDPTAPSTLYAVIVSGSLTGGGEPPLGSVFKSTDAGGNWQAMNAGLFVDGLALDPMNPATLYAGFESCQQQGGCSGEVFKSTDGASTWSTASADLPRVIALAVDPISPGTLYAVIQSCPLIGGGLIWGADDCANSVSRSTDGGATWGARTGLTHAAVRAFVVDPVTPGTLYAGTHGGGVLKSTDGGSSWETLNTGFTNIYISALAIDPMTPSRLYAGTGSGVFDIEQVAAKVVGTGTAASCTAAALNAARAGGGLVTFNCGGPATIDISTGTGTKTIAVDTIVDGGGLITISGGNAAQVFSVPANFGPGVKFGVQNLTIANGMAVNNGGGIGIFNGSTLTVANSTFAGNTGVSVSRGGDDTPLAGGGILSASATLIVTNSTFIGNSGGAIANGGGPLTVTNCAFTGNSGDSPAINSSYFVRGTLSVTRSTFTGNSGGGIANGGGPLTVTNSSFTANTTTNGGAGISNDLGGTLNVTNSTFAGNSATSPAGYGGGISNGAFGNGRLTVTNSTFAGNSAGDLGGGDIFNGGDTASLRNTIVANSAEGGNCSGSITDGGHNLDDGTSCGFNAANGSLSSTDPQLDPVGLQDNGGPTHTVALCTAVGVPAGCAAASPAIGAGDQAVCVAAPVNDRDQRGFVRPGPGHTQCSIGAFEADAIPAEACVGDCSGTSIVAIDDLITLVTIALGNAPPSACSHGVPSDADVNVAMIVRAVNNALNGCSGG